MKKEARTSLAVVLTSFLSTLFSCHYAHSQDHQIKTLNLIVSYPVVGGKGDLTLLPDTIPIIYAERYIIYKLPYMKVTTYDGALTSNKKQYSIFIFRKDDESGYLINDINDSIRLEKYPVDSILFIRGFTVKWDVKNINLVESKINRKAGTLLEKHIPNMVHDENTFDSIYYYYSYKLKNINFSFSRQLDSIKNMKLYQIKLKYNKKYSKINHVTFPKREFIFKIVESNVVDKKEIETAIQIVEGLK